MDVLLIDDNLDLIAPEVLDGVERIIGCSLPADYRAIMGAFGVGTYSGFIYFWHPSEIPQRTEYSRRIWTEYFHFFWPQSDSVLSLDLALQSFVLAITLDGDESAFRRRPNPFQRLTASRTGSHFSRARDRLSS